MTHLTIDGRRASVRGVQPDDLPHLRKIIDESELFPSDLLDEMVAPYFRGGDDSGFWLTVDQAGPQAIAYVAPERMTDGTWNLLLIAVSTSQRGNGIGGALLRHIEQTLHGAGNRVLLVETSGVPAFERTRSFYRANGYREEATIHDFYADGDDKVVFWKALNSST